MRKHHELRVWQEAISLVAHVYRVTAGFPKDEMYGLTSQMRRAAVSVPSNIAEGAARNTDKEFLHFLFVARGSLSELETHIQIAKILGYIVDVSDIDARTEEVFGLIGGLINSVQKRAS